MWTVLEHFTQDHRYVCRVKCGACGAEKVLRSKAVRSDTRCRSCNNIQRNRAHFGKHKGVGGLTRTFFGYFKNTARRRGILFAVTIEELSALFDQQGGRCALSGMELRFPIGTGYGGSLTDALSPSLDRKDSSKPYTLDNVQWVHKLLNIMKNSLTQDQFVGICHQVADRHANPQPSSPNGGRWNGGRKKMRPTRSVWAVGEKVQRLMGEDSNPIIPTRVPGSSQEEDKIVRYSDESRRVQG